ncbi:hypothetical protein ACGVWS_08925, partial [Enterobacteriaceae bacterium LUAb1]
EMTGRLLADRNLDSVLPAETLSGLRQMVESTRQILGHIRLLQTLPGDARPEAYLQIILSHPVAGQILGSQIQALGKVLADYQYPARQSLTGQLAWLSALLSREELHEALRPRIRQVLGEYTPQFFATVTFISRLRRFPAGLSTGRQMLWMLRNTTDVSVPALAWLGEMRGAPEIITRLTRLLSSPDAGKALVSSLARDILPLLSQQAAHYAGRVVLPAPVWRLLSAFREAFCQDADGYERGWNMLKTTATEALYWGGEAFLGRPLLESWQYATELSKYGDWQVTLKWFVAHDQSQNLQLQDYYSKALTALLFWNIYRTLGEGPREYQEASLRRLAAQLKEFGVVRAWPQLKLLTDLLPLLPSLLDARKRLRTLPQAESWSDWAEQWLNALEVRQSRELKLLRDELENWLADRVLSVCDSLVSREWGVLPGASAASVNAAVRASAAGSPVTVSPPYGSGQLAAGSGMAVTGAALTAYAIWQWRNASRPSPEPGKEGQAMLPASQRETRFFSEGTSRALPVLLGVAGASAMLAGGITLYRWQGAASGVAAHKGLTDAQYREALGFVRRLRLPDLDFLFYAAPAEGASAGEAFRSRFKRSGSVSHRDIPAALDGLKKQAGEQGLELVTEAFSQAEAQRHAPVHREESVARKDLRQLLDTLTGMGMILVKLASYSLPEANPFFRQHLDLYDRLWEIAGGLTDDDSQSLIATYRRDFMIGPNNRPEKVADSPASAVESPMPDLTQKVPLALSSSVARLEKLYNPILNPVAFLYEKIAHFIQAYNAETGSTLDVTPDTKVCIIKTLIRSTPPFRKLYYRSSPVIWSVMELATRLHLRNSLNLKWRDESLIYQRPDEEFSGTTEWGKAVKALVHSLQEKVDPLEQEMLRELNLYRNNMINRTGMTSLYQGMMTLRCLEYLDSPNNIPLYTQAVEKFLRGESQASMVLFHGVPLNGVFMVHADQYEGVMFSIDEPKFFHIGSGKKWNCLGSYRPWPFSPQSLVRSTAACNRITSIYPNTMQFSNWFFSKLPLKHALSYIQYGNAAFYSNADQLPVTFRQSMGAVHLANQLFDGLMDRMASDIDVLMWTYKEQVTLTLLEAVKVIFRFGSLALAIAAPLSGTILVSSILMLGSSVLSMGESPVSWGQAQIVDTHQQVSLYLSEALVAGILGSLALVPSGVQITAKGIQHVLASYRHIKQISGASISSVVSTLKSQKGLIKPIAGRADVPGSNRVFSGRMAASPFRHKWVSNWFRQPGGNITINGRTFKSLSYDQTQQQLMKQKAIRYQPVNNPTFQQKQAIESYQAGQKAADNILYSDLNNLPFGTQVEIYLDDRTADLIRGVLKEKISRGVQAANYYAVAEKAVIWGNAATKAQEVKLIPQNITLQGRPGECLPAVILMGRALETGWDAHLADRMWQMSFAQKINDDPLYQSLTMLHGGGDASVFNTSSFYAPGAAIKKPEETLFPAATGSVRIDLKEHTLLISKFFNENKVSRYVFYDPNYGLAYFNKFSDMSDFFVSALKKYRDIDAGVNFRYLDYARVADSGFDVKILDQMIQSSSAS